MTPKIGQRIMTAMDDAPYCIGTVIEGPIWKNGKAVFKVQIVDPVEGEYAIWLWPERMRPVISAV